MKRTVRATGRELSAGNEALWRETCLNRSGGRRCCDNSARQQRVQLVMAGQSWLESALRRSARLGLEVLERASRRSVDWTSSAASPSSTHTCNGGAHIHRSCTELSDAFGIIADFMDKTSCQCRRFYESGCCSEPSDAEKTHMSRFHTNPPVTRSSAPRPSRKPPRHRGKNAGRDSFTEEDFYIEVSPGTYAITASLPKSRHQTQMVSIKAGESIDLTFNL